MKELEEYLSTVPGALGSYDISTVEYTATTAGSAFASYGYEIDVCHHLPHGAINRSFTVAPDDLQDAVTLLEKVAA